MRISGMMLVVVLGMVLLPLSASANDTAATVGIGGLVLKKNKDIEMVSEVLEISPEKVRVTYHFLNTSDHDIKTTVAFPMPAYDYEPDPEENMGPLESFQTSVNGKDVSAQKNRVFLIDGVDATAKLRKLELTDAQIFSQADECLGAPRFHPDADTIKRCSLTKPQVSGINHLGGKLWQIQETAFWDQVFPANKDMTVVHQYQPKAGFNDSRSNLYGDGCVDAGTARLLSRLHDEDDGAMRTIREVKYILGTGRNWRGPIKHFKLILDKSGYSVVTLCFPGKAVKTSPTTIELNQTNYVAQDKLDVFFY